MPKDPRLLQKLLKVLNMLFDACRVGHATEFMNVLSFLSTDQPWRPAAWSPSAVLFYRQIRKELTNLNAESQVNVPIDFFTLTKVATVVNDDQSNPFITQAAVAAFAAPAKADDVVTNVVNDKVISFG